MGRALVVYESMYGNTRAIAEAVAAGLATTLDTETRRVGEVDRQVLSGADLLVVGAPTHTWGLSRGSTRRSAAQAALKPGSGLTLEPAADGIGVREWLDALSSEETLPAAVACFDTRMKAPLGFSGSAARATARKLRRRGVHLRVPVAKFFVDRANRLAPGEQERATTWGKQLGATVARAAVD